MLPLLRAPVRWNAEDRPGLSAVVAGPARPLRQERQGVAVPGLEHAVYLRPERLRPRSGAEQADAEHVLWVQQLALLAERDEVASDPTGRHGGEPARPDHQLQRS